MAPDQDADDEVAGEAEVSFEPRLQALAELGISPEDFEAALLVALEAREALVDRDDVCDDEIPFLEEMLLNIRGIAYKLEELADVEVRGGGA